MEQFKCQIVRRYTQHFNISDRLNPQPINQSVTDRGDWCNAYLVIEQIFQFQILPSKLLKQIAATNDDRSIDCILKIAPVAIDSEIVYLPNA